MKLFLKGTKCHTEKCAVDKRNFAPGQHGRDRKVKIVGYGLQLREKQKAKRIYFTLESQFRAYYEKANRSAGVTGEILLQQLERRLDNVAYRLGFASSRRQSRQIVRHGHVEVNGRKANIPSYQVRPEDVISIKLSSSAGDTIRKATELVSTVPAWLQADHDSLTAKVLRYPERAEISAPVQEQLIVELYSK